MTFPMIVFKDMKKRVGKSYGIVSTTFKLWKTQVLTVIIPDCGNWNDFSPCFLFLCIFLGHNSNEPVPLL